MSQSHRPPSASMRSRHRHELWATSDAPLPAIGLVLEGEHIQADDRSFRSFLFDLITRTPGHPIHLDMREVTVLDSATLGTLIAALKGAHVSGGDVCITAASPQVRSVLEITGTAAILMATDDQDDEAAAQVRGAR